jgi:hypothetical protein
MKQLIIKLGLLAAGLGVCGCLVHRHYRHPTRQSQPRPAQASRPMNEWQRRLTLDPRTDYRADRQARYDLMQQLRQEELRQKPQEGRN